MGDRVDCIGVYVDDRVRSERWVRRNSIDTSTLSSAGSLVFPDEPDALQSDVEQLLEVCKKSKFLAPELCDRLKIIRALTLSLSLPVSHWIILCNQAGRAQRPFRQRLYPDICFLWH